MELLEWLHLLSANVKVSNLNDYSFVFYVLVSLLIKKSRYILAFFFCVLIVECSLFDFLMEFEIYLTSFTVYSYLVTASKSLKIKVSCAIMCVLDLILFRDALYYGVNGIHGEYKTAIYNNIEYLAFVVHIIIILSLVPFGKIYDCICGLLDHVFGGSANSYNMSFFWYTIRKI